MWVAALLLILAVGSGTPPHIDQVLSEAASDVAGPWTEAIGRIFALMGSALVLPWVTVGVVLVLASRGHRWWATWIGVAGMGGWVISETIKHLVQRQRPQWPDPFATLTSASMPSGHSMAGIYGWFAFGVAAWALGHRAIGGLLMACGLLMGPSRVLFGVHWPTDVLAGWLLAGAWLLTIAAVLNWRWGPPSEDRTG